MTLWEPLSAVVLVILVSVAYEGLARIRAWHRIRHIPGPVWARWSRIWLVKQIYTGTYVNRLQELHAQYGPVVCLSPDLVAVSDPVEIRSIGNVRSPWGRGTPYFGFRTAPGEDSLFSQRDKQAHGILRKKLMGGYSGKAVDMEGVHDMMDRHVLEFVKLLRRKYSTTPEEYRPVDLSRLVMYFATDFISSFAFGKSFGCLERDDDFHTFLKSTSKIAAPMVSACMLPFFQKIQDTPALKVIMPKGSFLRPILQIAQDVVAERFGPSKVERRDVLGVWVANGLNEKEALVESIGQLAAGGDTTATAIRATMLFLMTSPHVYKKLQAEIDGAVASGAITLPASASGIQSLPYLQAVIKEGLRLFPPVAMMPRISDAPQELCGIQIPAGINVELSVKTALRDRSIFGQDADVFRPERWTDELDSDKLVAMEETSRFTFGGPSRWECLGKGLAIVQIQKLVSELVREFDLTLVNPAQPWIAKGNRVWSVTNMFVTVTPRIQGSA